MEGSVREGEAAPGDSSTESGSEARPPPEEEEGEAGKPLAEQPEGGGDESASPEEEGSGEEGEGEWIDRRGSVLMGKPEAPKGGKTGDQGPGVTVSIPPPVGAPSSRSGSSFVSTVFRTVGPAVPR